MSTVSRQTTNTVLVGRTPVPKYVSWDEHRDAMHRASKARRTEMERQRLETAANQRSSV